MTTFLTSKYVRNGGLLVPARFTPSSETKTKKKLTTSKDFVALLTTPHPAPCRRRRRSNAIARRPLHIRVYSFLRLFLAVILYFR